MHDCSYSQMGARQSRKVSMLCLVRGWVERSDRDGWLRVLLYSLLARQNSTQE